MAIGIEKVESGVFNDVLKDELHEFAKAHAAVDSYVECDDAIQTCPPANSTPAVFNRGWWDAAQGAIMYSAMLSSLQLFSDHANAERLLKEYSLEVKKMADAFASGAQITDENAARLLEHVHNVTKGLHKTSGRPDDLMLQLPADSIQNYELGLEGAKAWITNLFLSVLIYRQIVEDGEKGIEARAALEEVFSKCSKGLRDLSDRAHALSIVETDAVKKMAWLNIKATAEFYKRVVENIHEKVSEGADIKSLAKSISRFSDSFESELVRGKGIVLLSSLPDADKAVVRDRISAALKIEDAAKRTAAVVSLFSEMGVASSRDQFLVDMVVSDDISDTLAELDVPGSEARQLWNMAKADILKRMDAAELISAAEAAKIQARRLLEAKEYKGALDMTMRWSRIHGLILDKVASKDSPSLEMEIRMDRVLLLEVSAKAHDGLNETEEAAEARKNIVSTLEGMLKYISEKGTFSERMDSLALWATFLRGTADEYLSVGKNEQAQELFRKAADAHVLRAMSLSAYSGFRNYAERGYSFVAAADLLKKASSLTDIEKQMISNRYAQGHTALRDALRMVDRDAHSMEAVHSLAVMKAHAMLQASKDSTTFRDAVEDVREALRLGVDPYERFEFAFTGEKVTLDGILTEALQLSYSDAELVIKQRALVYIQDHVTEDSLGTEKGRERLRKLFKEAGFNDVPEAEAEFSAKLWKGEYRQALKAMLSPDRVDALSRSPISASESFRKRNFGTMGGFTLFGK